METVIHARALRCMLAALFLATLFVALPATEAHAACQHDNRWTSVNLGSSQNMNKASGTTCSDLNAKKAYTRSDYVRGWYHTGSGWQVGSNGWRWVNQNEGNWAVLLTSVRAGATMRGQGYSVSQTVRYMH